MGLAGRDQHDDAGRRRRSSSTTPGTPASTRSRARTPGSSTLLGGGAALAFAVALLASGLSSSSVGTFAGQVVMQGFIDRRIPLFLRRAITMAPSLVVLGDRRSTRRSRWCISQVVLSFGIPFALVPMILLTRRARRDGRARQPRARRRSWPRVVAAMIIALNVFLLYADVLRLTRRGPRLTFPLLARTIAGDERDGAPRRRHAARPRRRRRIRWPRAHRRRARDRRRCSRVAHRRWPTMIVPDARSSQTRADRPAAGRGEAQAPRRRPRPRRRRSRRR